MKYFIDTEFHEYHKKVKVCGIPIGKPIPTIDLISIGIVAEDDRTYYAISKDFNLKDAWNSFQMKQAYGDERNRYPKGKKEYWLRDNVLKPVFDQLNSNVFNGFFHQSIGDFTYGNLQKLIAKHGKTNQQIAQEIKEFTCVVETDYPDDCQCGERNTCYSCQEISKHNSMVDTDKEIQFHGYYSDYDWVVFAQLFGKMIDLPKGFPMYCIDLKQMIDEKAKIFMPLEDLKRIVTYPKQANEHSAIHDAQWNYKLYKFLNTL